MYHDRTCSAKSNVSNLFYSKKRTVCLMTVFIYKSCPRSKTNKLFLKIVSVCGLSRLSESSKLKDTELIVGNKKLLDWCTLFSSPSLTLSLPHLVSSSIFAHLMRKNRRQTQEGEISTAESGCEMGKQIVSNEQRGFFLNWRDTEMYCFWQVCFLLPLSWFAVYFFQSTQGKVQYW